MVADLARTGNTDLCYQKAVVANLNVVSDLHQVVDLRARPDSGFAEGSAINAHIGPQFHIVLEHHDPDLRHFVMDTVDGCKTEAVSAYYGAGVDGAAVTDPTPVFNYYPRVEYAIGPNRDAAAENAARPDNTSIPDPGSGAHYSQRPDACPVVQYGIIGDHRGGVSPR